MMTESSKPHSFATAVGDSPTVVPLQGKLGVGSIVFTVVAWAAPLLVVVGLMPSVIGFAGNGIVAAFVLVTLIILVFAVGYATLTRHVDRPGAFYAYIVAGLGKIVGLGGGFVAVFGYLLILLATLPAFGIYFSQVVSGTFNGPETPWYLWSALGVVAIGFLSYRKIELSARVLSVLLIIEVLLVLIFNLSVLFNGGPDGPPTALFTAQIFTSNSFGLALLFGVLCFIGFESAAIYREEAKDPEKTISRATYVAVILIGVFYIFAAWSLLMALGTSGVAGIGEMNLSTIFGELAGNYLGAVFPELVNVLVVTSTFACILATRNAVARYIYSLGRDEVFPKKLGSVHKLHGSPYVASMVVSYFEIGAIVVIAAATGFAVDGTLAFIAYVRGVGIATVAILFLMTLVAVAVVVYFRRHRVPNVRARIWTTLIAPVLGLVGLTYIFIMGLINVDALIGAGPLISSLLTLILPIIFVAGILYAVYLRRAKPEVFARIGRQ